LKRPPLCLKDDAKYAAMVLWLHGLSIGGVAKALSKFVKIPVQPDQVRGVLRNSPFYNRGTMDINERQNHLDILGRERLDGGRIKPWAFRAKVLTDGRQK